MLRPRLLTALTVFALAGCTEDVAPELDDTDDAPLGGGKADGLSDAEFFGDQSFYMFQVKGWDRTRMANDRLAEKVCAGDPGLEFATLTVAIADPKSNTHCPSIAAENVIFETDQFCLRTSGNLTKGTPKSSYAIELDDDDNRLAGMKEVNLKSMWNDVSQMRESIAWTMFGDAQIHAERHTYAKLCMDPRGSDAPNVYRGLYSVIEEVDKQFIKARFGKNDDGNLYKANWADIGPGTLGFRGENGEDYFTAEDIGDRTYELETNEDEDDPTEFQTYDDLAKLVAVVNGVGLEGGDEKFDTDAYRESVEDIFDARGFLRWAALNMLMGAWDNYWRTPSNYYLYNAGHANDPKAFMDDPYFYWLPHDYDNTFGIDFFRKDWQRVDILDWEAATAGAFETGTNKRADLPLIRNLLRNEHFKAYYLDFMEFALDEIFTEAFVLDHIGDEGTGGAWDRVRASAFLEADGPTLAPHTGRQFTNDQVFWNGFKQIQLPDVPTSQLQPGQQFTLGIVHHVRMRIASARQQLEDLRETIPRGSSGVTFPDAITPVPRR
jgi:hypothetical protein